MVERRDAHERARTRDGARVARSRGRSAAWIGVLALGGACWLTACSDDGGTAAPAAPEPERAASAPAAAPSAVTQAAATERSEAERVEAGRAVYNANCIACHNMDPTRDGALGPAVAGSSLALLEARVVHGGYPEGYVPKRNTRVMVPLPHLEPKLPELEAYLASLD